MDYNSIVKQWSKSSFKSPSILLLKCLDDTFIVIDDSSTIIYCYGKAKTIFTIVKSCVTVTQNGSYKIYTVTDPRFLKVISCSDNLTLTDRTKFVVDNFSKFF